MNAKGLALVSVLILAAAPAAVADDWNLVWSDEFDRPGLPDPSRWIQERGLAHNNEKQYYTRGRWQNARVEHGYLVIEARKEPWEDSSGTRIDGHRGGPTRADYTSARLTTEGKAAWTYGRMVARAKLPEGRGTWPAFWMLGSGIHEVGWPACGEIDILEHVGYDPGVIHANVHTKKYNHSVQTGKGDKTTVADASREFHDYAVEWDARKMDFYVDDRKYFTYVNEGSGDVAWPFDRPQFLILNLAVGGDWGGQKGIDDATFPQRFLIDYVRVYQKQAGSR